MLLYIASSAIYMIIMLQYIASSAIYMILMLLYIASSAIYRTSIFNFFLNIATDDHNGEIYL